MSPRIPGAAKALLVVTAAGLLLGGCHYGHRAYHGGPHYAAPHHSQHYHGDYKRERYGSRHRSHRDGHRSRR